VDLSVRRGWQIDRDARARVSQAGFLSAMVIAIRGGGAQALLEPGAEISSEEAPDVLAALSHAAGQIAVLLEQDVRPLLVEASRTVPEVLSHANAFAAQLETSSRRLNDILGDQNIASVRNAVRNAEAVSADLAALTSELGETRKRLDAAMSAVQRLVESNEGGVEQGVRDLQYSLEAIARRIDGVSHNLEGASRNLNEFSREIRENPSLLLRGTEPPADGGARVSN
jgi:phospholipid/cholesterol/gamma-HCH transport system substrate-binding protein